MVQIKEFPRWVKTTLILAVVVASVVFVAGKLEIALPGTPSLYNTLTPLSQPSRQEMGSYDLLGRVISASEAAEWVKTEEGKQQLSPENGAVEVSQDLVDFGRRVFYTETFGNEVFQTDVAGALNGPINLKTMTKAIAKLAGKHTTNLQIPIDQEVTIGKRNFPAGTLLNTGLDVPAGSLLPLGMRAFLSEGKLRVGITCALCHGAVDAQSGRIIEGAPNVDLDSGTILAFATNSAAMFRQTGVDPKKLPKGGQTYLNELGKIDTLPDIKTLEDAVDEALLQWPPGNFDSTGTLVNNPSQIPSSYTFQNHPYGWSGFSAIGWFKGLTTLNNNVHATNSDPTTGADGSQKIIGIDKETYLGIILQNSANPKFRLPKNTKPSEFFNRIDPTPGNPGINETIKMPGYPQGSAFMLDGLMAVSPGKPVAQQLNALSAWQNSLSPPPHADADLATLQQGAKIFNKAGCVECHSGRYFTNNRVIPQIEVGTQPSRGPTLTAFAENFTKPTTYPPNLSTPLPANPPVLDVPTETAPQKDRELSYGLNHPRGGYKVPSLIGLAVTAPYLHDGGVAAAADALQLGKKNIKVINPQHLGMAGTLLQNISPDPAASLRVLVDRNLRKTAVAHNRKHPDLQATQIDGSGHNYWVDRRAGYSLADQSALIEFLLSLDDDPAIVP